MPTNPSDVSGNWLQRAYYDVKEYVERCFGVNDIETRYAREVQEHRKPARNSHSRLPAQNNGDNKLAKG